MLKRLSIFVALLLVAFAAQAQMRALPEKGKRATVDAQQLAVPLISLGGTVARLAPGGVIYDQNNRMIVHTALPLGADVIYTTDINGDIGHIYVLTPQEQAQLNQRR